MTAPKSASYTFFRSKDRLGVSPPFLHNEARRHRISDATALGIADSEQAVVNSAADLIRASPRSAFGEVYLAPLPAGSIPTQNKGQLAPCPRLPDVESLDLQISRPNDKPALRRAELFFPTSVAPTSG